MIINFVFKMTNREKESILNVNKFLAICKDDSQKFTTMRNYLNKKLTKLFNEQIERSNDKLDYRSLIKS